MPKRGSISDKDAKTVANSIDADGVKDLGCSISFNIVAGSRHDQSKSCKSSAEQEALRSAEDVESLCDTQIGDTSNDRAHHARSRRERVHCESGCDIWDQSAADTRDKTLDEVDEPDQNKSDHQRGSGPRERNGLDVLYAMLEVDVYRIVDRTFCVSIRAVVGIVVDLVQHLRIGIDRGGHDARTTVGRDAKATRR